MAQNPRTYWHKSALFYCRTSFAILNANRECLCVSPSLSQSQSLSLPVPLCLCLCLCRRLPYTPRTRHKHLLLTWHQRLSKRVSTCSPSLPAAAAVMYARSLADPRTPSMIVTARIRVSVRPLQEHGKRQTGSVVIQLLSQSSEFHYRKFTVMIGDMPVVPHSVKAGLLLLALLLHHQQEQQQRTTHASVVIGVAPPAC